MRLREALEAIAAIRPEAFEDLRRGIDPSLSGDPHRTAVPCGTRVPSLRSPVDPDWLGPLGMTIVIGFNPKYVVELLTQMASDQVTVAFGGELDPG